MSRTVHETERTLRAVMVLPLKPGEDPEQHIGRNVLAFCVNGTHADRLAKTRAMLVELRDDLVAARSRGAGEGGEKWARRGAAGASGPRAAETWCRGRP